jgi:formylglycine-generating enzyme required for sulfatase activity
VSVAKNFSQIDKNQVRVIRGGSWQSNPGPLRVASRGNYFPSFMLRNCGFRCVKPVIGIKGNTN